MPTIPTDQQSFLAAIISEPDEDTHRLVYADWLDEHGDPDRAEFIRVQCEWERLKFVSHPNTAEGRAETARVLDLQVRESELLRLHEREWRRAGPCVACEGKGTLLGCAGDRHNPDCPECFGGDTGGLLYQMSYLGCFKYENVNVEVEFRRGFPFRVTVPTLGHALVEVPQVKLGYGQHTTLSPLLKPTPWLNAVLAHHPVQEVVPLDKRPVLDEGGYEWYDLPDALCVPGVKETFVTLELAVAALALAVATVGRRPS